MAIAQKKLRSFETIDLTGETPIIKKKFIEENITVVNLESEEKKKKKKEEESEPLTKESKPNKRQKKKQCEVCLNGESKYTCPCCKMKTCCLSCAKKHKKIKNCSGEKKKVGFVARSDFNDMHLFNDLRFLEEVKRLVDNAQRDHKSKPVRRISKKVHLLQKAVKNRGCKLFRMAKGMQRWKENKNFYNVKEDVLHWTIKFVFEEIYETIITKHPETETFKDILSPFVDREKVLPENKIRFLEYTNRHPDQNIVIFFKHELEQGQGNTRFSEVNINSTIKESLMGMSILEYPEYKVILSSNAHWVRNELFVRDNLLNIKEESGESSSESSSTNTSDNEETDENPKKTLEEVLREMGNGKLQI